MNYRKHESPPPSRLPHELIWALATLSLVLPFIAFGLGAVGLWRVLHDVSGGWPLIGLAIVAQAVDLVIDLWLANPHISASEEPHLNCRGSQCIGRVGPLVEPIEGGRGKVRLGDSVWTVECTEDLRAGAMVRVVGSDGVVLMVVSN